MTSRLLLRALLTALPAVAPLSLSAQAQAPVSAPATPPPATASEARNPTETQPAPIELSPFEVRPGDVGYQAANTTSGSRLNTSLKDTPAAISPFTPELLSDIAATNLEEMLAYAVNVEPEFDDSIAGFSNTASRTTGGSNYNFRIRGQAGGVSRDYIETDSPTDLYNVERAEVASGPNSILFGIGATGGLVSITGKKAQLNRDRLTLKSVIGSWDYTRFEADYNKVIIPRVLSVRALGLYQNASGWREYTWNDQKRLTAAVTYKPFKSTTLNASYEKGKLANNISVAWNAYDQTSRWDAAGRPAFDGAASAATGTASFGANNRFTFDERGGRVYNYRNELQSTTLRTGSVLADPGVFPYDINPTGPGGQRWQSIESRQFLLTQQLPHRISVELAYFHNESDAFVHAFGGNNNGIDFRADPNLTIADVNGVAVANPNARRYYLDNQWQQERGQSSNDVARLSAAWEVDAGKWLGRHRVAGLYENAKKDDRRRPTNEILVDQNNVPIVNVDQPENGLNALIRRNYTDTGDFNTYYAGNPQIVLPSFTYTTLPAANTNSSGLSTTVPRRITSRFVPRSGGYNGGDRTTNTWMIATQSFWFKDRFISTVGYRLDEVEASSAKASRITDRNDPRVRSGAALLNQFDFDGTFEKATYEPTTFTAGAVVKPLKRASLLFNTSRNTGLPNFNRIVLPDGKPAPPSDGIDNSYGFMLDLTGDDRYFVRTTLYKTEQLNNASITPAGLLSGGAPQLGAVALENIIEAFYQAGKLTLAQRDAQAIPYNAATSDVTTRGIEVELVANPTPALSLRLSYTKSERERGDFFNEIYTFWAAKEPEFRATAAGNPALLSTVEAAIREKDDALAAQFDRQRGSFGNRPHKASTNVRYKLPGGILRGTTIGGGLRYQSRNFIGYDLVSNREYWGNETLFADTFATYRTRLPRFKIPVTFQLNVKNLSNSYGANPAKYNADFTGYFRVYLNEPRSYRFTTTLEF